MPIPTAAHQAFRLDAIALLRKYSGDLPAQEMLALCAHLTGQVIAYQDQRTMDPVRAMEIVYQNLAMGNQEATAEVRGAPQGKA